MMKGNNGKKKTIVDEVKEILKDFDSRKVKAIKHLGDVSWVAKMMGCNDKIVTDTFNDASHEFSELDDKTRSVVLSAYADGMYSCKTRLEKGTDAFDRMRKFINGVTNCYAAATGQSKDDITDTDKLFSVWMVQYIYYILTDTKTADTFNASQSQSKQPKQPKDETKTDEDVAAPVADTLFTKWASKLKTKDADTAELIDLCANELSMYVFENMSNDNAVGEICAYAMPSDIDQLSEKIAVALTGSAVDKILSDINGFAAQLCELAKLVGIPSWMEVDGITKPDTTHDSYEYEYKRPKSVMKKLLDDEFSGDVYKYLGIA